MQGSAMLLVNLVKAHRVGNKLDQAAIGTGCQDFIRFHPQVHLLEFEYLVDLADQLHSELLLPNIVIGFDDDSEETPGLQVAKRRLLLNPLLLLP